jgi:glycosyltransferase involved in cell wall biosynthesis
LTEVGILVANLIQTVFDTKEEGLAVFLSIIVPVYNVEMYLEECIESVLKQTLVELELILVNDGSSDASGYICKQYQSIDSRVLYVEQKNTGSSSARNLGLEKSKGLYVHFLDADDRLDNNNTYSNIYKATLEKHYDVVVGRADYYDSNFNDKIEFGRIPIFRSFENGNVLSHILKNKLFYVLTCGTNKIYRRQFLLDNNLLWPLHIVHEDDYLLPRLMNCSGNLLFFHEVIYNVRRRSNSITSTKTKEHLLSRGCGTQYTAIENCKYLLNNIKDKSALEFGMDYYIKMYFEGLFIAGKCNENGLKRYEILEYFLYSYNLKHKLLYYLSFLISKKVIFELMIKRYKIHA